MDCSWQGDKLNTACRTAQLSNASLPGGKRVPTSLLCGQGTALDDLTTGPIRGIADLALRKLPKKYLP
jgi:hypothetical protein